MAFLVSACTGVLESPTPTPTPFSTSTATATRTATPSKTPSHTPSPTPSWTASPSASPTSVAASLTPSLTPFPEFTFTPTTAASSLTRFCRTDDPANWLRSKLQLLSACEVMSGAVVWTGYNPGDGDFTFDTLLDAGQEGYLNDGNLTLRSGALHCEIEPGEAHLGYPSVGMHVVMVGAWVYDKSKGWNEIHPIWYWTETP